MGSAAAGPFLAAAGLLVLAGVPKLLDPAPLVRALGSVGLPSHALLVRVLAAGEVVIGVSAVMRPGRLTAVPVGVSYLAFTAFVALALTRGGVLASCGCFGRPDTPPTRTHALVTAGLAVASGLVASEPPERFWSGAAVLPTATLVALAALIGALAYLVMAVLPTVTPAAVRSASAPRRTASHSTRTRG